MGAMVKEIDGGDAVDERERRLKWQLMSRYSVWKECSRP
jgi:hypothetical protein